MQPHQFNFENQGQHHDSELHEHFEKLPLSKNAHRLLQSIGIFKSGLDLSDKNPHKLMDIDESDGKILAKKVIDLHQHGHGSHPKIKKLNGYLKGHGFLGDAWDKVKNAASSVHEHLAKEKYLSKLLNTPVLGEIIKKTPVLGTAAKVAKVWTGYGETKEKVFQENKTKGKGKRILK